MGNSNIALQEIVDFASTMGDIAPVLKAAGYSTKMPLIIANDTMQHLLSPKMPWKWNRMNVIQFYTVSWQQDYALPVTNLAWLEHAFLRDINNTALPKPIFTLETDRDLEATSQQYGRSGQISWLPNDQLQYGTWGGGISTNGGGQNPGPLAQYSALLNVSATPSNPLTQIIDPHGNFLVLSNINSNPVCGSTPPDAGATPVIGATVTDGSCVWVVVDPKGQGMRLTPIPPQAGVVYQVNVVAQMRPPVFTSLAQKIDPVPDDFASAFRDGFIAHCYRHSVDPDMRAKFSIEYGIWQESLIKAVEKGNRERESYGFYPANNPMSQGQYEPVGPANPFGGW